jgi:hypothetical protein
MRTEYQELYNTTLQLIQVGLTGIIDCQAATPAAGNGIGLMGWGRPCAKCPEKARIGETT